MAGDVEGLLLLEMRDLDKLKSKLEIIMEKRMLDTCQHKYGLESLQKSIIRRDVDISNPCESPLNITALLVRLVQTITNCLGIKYYNLCFQERNYCYLLAYTTICSALIIDYNKLGDLSL